MRLIKILGLAMVVVCAVTAFIGVGSAAAQEKHLVVLCKVEPKVGELCLEGQLYKKPETIEAELENYEGVKQAILLSEGVAGNGHARVLP